MRGNSLQGYTKRCGRSPGHSPGFQLAGQLSVRQYLVITNMMVRYYLTGSRMGTTILLRFLEDNTDNRDNNSQVAASL